jgi:hydroxyethylthiazole kinase-like uncharacterized protein yjeF
MSSLSQERISPVQFEALFEPRQATGHKGTFGSAAILGGAQGMTGAVMLASRCALKAGAGKVYVGVTQLVPDIGLDPLQPEVMWRQADSLIAMAQEIQAWGVGCGLGSESAQWLKAVFQVRDQAPLVVDADALNALAHGDVAPVWGSGVVVLTPHPAEAARLLGTTTKVIQHDRLLAAKTLAERFRAWVVLKGHHTVVSDPDGHCQINPSGNVGLATAGTGDVLTGLITSLLAQGFEPSIAVPAAVWLHGTAAETLTQQLGGPVGLTACELIDTIRMLRNQTVA